MSRNANAENFHAHFTNEHRLSMLATVAANDFGYMTIDDLVDRNLRTLETLAGLSVSKAIF